MHLINNVVGNWCLFSAVPVREREGGEDTLDKQVHHRDKWRQAIQADKLSLTPRDKLELPMKLTCFLFVFSVRSTWRKLTCARREHINSTKKGWEVKLKPSH